MAQDVLKQQEAAGTFRPCGRYDVLTAAVGKPDRPGRVKGFAGGLGLRDVFGRASNSSSLVRIEDISALLADVKEQARAEAAAALQVGMSQMRQEITLQLTQGLREKIREEMREEMMSLRTSTQETTIAHEKTAARQSTKGSCSTFTKVNTPSQSNVPSPHHSQPPPPTEPNELVSPHLSQLQDPFEPNVALSPHISQPHPPPESNVPPSPHHSQPPHPSELNPVQRVISLSQDPSLEMLTFSMDRDVVGKDGIGVVVFRDDLASVVGRGEELTIAAVQVFLM